MAELTTAKGRVFRELGWRARRHIRLVVRKAFAYTATTVLAILFAIPFFWMVSLSLKTPADIAQYPPRWIPSPIDWRNYQEAWYLAPQVSSSTATVGTERKAMQSERRSFTLFFKNSAVITLLETVGTLLSCTLVAFGFSRLEFPGRDICFVLVLSTMMIPQQVIFIPQYVLFAKLKWINSIKPLVVPSFFGGAFNIFLLRQFFLTLPREMDEAALVDGASYLQIFYRIILPLSKPVLVTVIAFSFIAGWNDFFGPLVYLHAPDKWTVAVALASFRGEVYTQTDYLMAASTMAVAPIVVVFLLAQRHFIAGVQMTGLKG